MAKEILTEEYQDDILAANMNGLRKYRMINNGDNTFSFVDVTEYETVGTEIGAAELKRISKNINESADKNKIIDDLEIIKNVTEEGYIAGAKAVGALNSNLENVNESLEDNKLIFNSGKTTISSIAVGMHEVVTVYFEKPFKTTNYLFFAYCGDGGYTGYCGFEYIENGGKFTDKCVFRFRNTDTTNNADRPIFWEAIGY